MVKITLSCLALLVGCLAAAHLGAQPPPAPRITEEYRGGPVTLRVGERLLLDLRNPASGGYRTLPPEFDVRVLKLVSERQVPREERHRGRMGDFGRLHFELEAVALGETEVKVLIFRPWEKGKTPEPYLRFRVVVAP